MRLYARKAIGLALIALLAAPSLALAEDTVTPRATLDFNLASIHTERWARDSLNQVNPGLGITTRLSDSWSVSGGAYKNSFSRLSLYALVNFTPIRLQLFHSGWHVDAGVAGGLVSGYRRQEMAAAPFAGAGLLRVVSRRGIALSIMGVPNYERNSGFVGFQFNVPLTF
ncbi:hypothetical protein CH75_16735 [Dyella jiangningensis]|nr:hypothetical protein CH75_16735 [Dyella jiangningensis]